MRAENKKQRQSEIEDCALELLSQKGFEGTSMKTIAKHAKASMETLYNWYGDKSGLFAALVGRNAAKVLTVLQEAEATNGHPKERLTLVAQALLAMLSSTDAVALNRAAINDPSGALGGLLSASGRAAVGPHLARVLIAWRDLGQIDFDDAGDAAKVFVGLLVGDHQIQRATGAVPPLSPTEVATQTQAAIDLFEKVFSADRH